MRNKRIPGSLHFPQQNNFTTGLCGISATYKINKKRDNIKRPCFSIHIAPFSVVSRNFNEFNKEIKLKEAMLIRKNAVLNWPNYTSKDAKELSSKLHFDL